MPNPTKQKPKRSRHSGNRWQCFAHVRGRLRRSSDRKSLFLQCNDGAMLTVSSIARSEPKTLVWLFANADRAFNQEQVWLIYPQSHPNGSNSVTAVAIVNQQRDEDILEFSACVGNIDLEERPGVLPLFVGRNQGAGYHFLNIQIPEGFNLPKLEARQQVRGTARRNGDEFVLQTLIVPWEY